MMAGVKEADVVITNPQHFAVALKYDIEYNESPVVIAKGQDNVAFQIIKEAGKYNIMSVQNPPLARALYASAEIGQEIGSNIPEELLFALADIIIALYQKKNKFQDMAKRVGGIRKNNNYNNRTERGKR
jgi:flagellar biosynthetic protein FlhB